MAQPARARIDVRMDQREGGARIAYVTLDNASRLMQRGILGYTQGGEAFCAGQVLGDPAER